MEKETLALKVFGGAVTARTERKENEGSGEWRREKREQRTREGRTEGAESSIIEGKLAAAERTMASFYPASVGDFWLDLIILRFTWRRESCLQWKLFVLHPIFFFYKQTTRHRVVFSGAALLVFTASTIARPDLVTVIYSYKHGGNTVTCYLLECFRAASLIYWRVVNSMLGCCRDIQNRLKCVSVCFCVEVLTKSHSAGLTECRVTLPTSTSVLRLSDKS